MDEWQVIPLDLEQGALLAAAEQGLEGPAQGLHPGQPQGQPPTPDERWEAFWRAQEMTPEQRREWAWFRQQRGLGRAQLFGLR